MKYDCETFPSDFDFTIWEKKYSYKKLFYIDFFSFTKPFWAGLEWQPAIRELSWD